jgi:drug/metabolite transporter (DMT)-like permease
MSGKTVNSAIVILIIGNLMAVISDVIIKAASEDIALFQFVAMRLVCTILLLLPFWRMMDRDNFFAGTRIHLVRAHLGLVGITCMVIALGALPLAVANALFYLAPVLIMVFGVLFFGERLRGMSLFAVLSGFVGVLLILRPGEITWAGLAAIGLAVTIALSALLVRKLPRQQSVIHCLMISSIYALPAALALALWEGEALDLSLLGAAFGSSFFVLGYNASLILAYRHVDANQVTASEYTGLIWAFLIGWLWFSEVPDAWFYAGAALIVVPLLMIALRTGAARRRAQRVTAPGT